MDYFSFLSELSKNWYQILAIVSALFTEPLRESAFATKIPFIAAFLFGVMGSLSPCQLSANLSAMAYLSKQAGDQRPLFREALAYMWGKIMVYSLLGILALAIGYQLPSSAMSWFRRLLGPAMIITGLYFLRALPIAFTLGKDISERLAKRSTGKGSLGAFSLGAATSLAFCPTMALLFFGLLIPLASNTSMGIGLPPVFAIGVALPLLLFAFVLSLSMSRNVSIDGEVNRFSKYLRSATGIVFLTLGINDTFLYVLA